MFRHPFELKLKEELLINIRMYLNELILKDEK